MQKLGRIYDIQCRECEHRIKGCEIMRNVILNPYNDQPREWLERYIDPKKGCKLWKQRSK